MTTEWIKVLIIIIFTVCLIFWANWDSKNYRKEFEKLFTRNDEGKVSSLEVVLELEKLIFQIQNMDIEKYHKEKILKTIEFEKYIIESEIVKKLGEKVFEDLKKEKDQKEEKANTNNQNYPMKRNI